MVLSRHAWLQAAPAAAAFWGAQPRKPFSSAFLPAVSQLHEENGLQRSTNSSRFRDTKCKTRIVCP